MECPRCTAALPDDDLFCEACGVRLGAAPARPGCACGAPPEDIDEDGFCSRCGHRARRPDSDHLEEALSPDCAAVSDRGVKHARNEDRFGAAQAGRGYALVVCDGVSSSRQSELASSAVAERVASSLALALRGGGVSDACAEMRRSIAEGEAALGSQPLSYGQDPPSTTAVAALVLDGSVTVGWVGDSRAYWIADGAARQLTVDHSWMNAVVSEGQMTMEEAAKAPQAHAITRWLGADAGDYAKPDTAQFAIPGPGSLLLCTDGLWNYAPEPEHIAKLVTEASADGADALHVARRLIEFAIGQGGVDNITAIVLRLHGEKAN